MCICKNYADVLHEDSYYIKQVQRARDKDTNGASTRELC